MNKITLISDVHGKYDQYLAIAKQHEYTIQLGDMGFSYDHMKNLDAANHKFITGNHDNHDIAYDVRHCLGHYGVAEMNGIEFFFIRGAFSIDFHPRIVDRERTGFKSWWDNEQMSDQELLDCIDLYCKVKPKVVLSHDCPPVAKNFLTNPDIMKRFGLPVNLNCRTQRAMREMFDRHKPKIWWAAHYHQNWTQKIDGCRFFCMEELGIGTIEKIERNKYKCEHADQEIIV